MQIVALGGNLREMQTAIFWKKKKKKKSRNISNCSPSKVANRVVNRSV